MSFINLCRSCMKEVDVEDCTDNVIQMFQFCTNIQVLTDKLPKNFCSSCTCQIESSYKYIKLAQEINETLLKLVNDDYETDFIKTNHEDGICQYDSIIDDVTNNDDDDEQNNEEVKAEDLVLPCKLNEIKKRNKISSSTNERNETQNDTSTSDNNNELVDELVFANTEVQLENDNSKTKFSNKPKISDSNYESSENVCPICQRVFSYDTKGIICLKRHMKSHSTSEKKLKDVHVNSESMNDVKVVKDSKIICPKCQKSFTSQTWFKKHMDKEHCGQQSYFCPFCSKGFETSHQYRYHKRKHLENKDHVCNACGKRFKFRKHLAVHSLTHSEERPFICDICHLSFKMKHVLVNHMKVHEKREIFLCYICGKHLASASNLDTHMTVHTKERPHACRWCEYRTNHRTAIRIHELRHLSLRKHVCKHCQKRFYDSGSLHRHIRTHTGERPFRCPYCPLSFPDAWKRKTHLMRVHQLTLEEIPKLTRDGAPRIV